MRTNEVEFWYDNTTLLVADVTDCDEETAPIIENLGVIVYIGGFDHDVTDSSVIQKALGHFMEVFRDRLQKRYEADGGKYQEEIA